MTYDGLVLLHPSVDERGQRIHQERPLFATRQTRALAWPWVRQGIVWYGMAEDGMGGDGSHTA
jgi:hypothetical protein